MILQKKKMGKCYFAIGNHDACYQRQVVRRLSTWLQSIGRSPKALTSLKQRQRLDREPWIRRKATAWAVGPSISGVLQNKTFALSWSLVLFSAETQDSAKLAENRCIIDSYRTLFLSLCRAMACQQGLAKERAAGLRNW